VPGPGRVALLLVVDTAPSGGLRFASPQLGSDWCRVARTPGAIVAAVAAAVSTARAAPTDLPVTVEDVLSGRLDAAARTLAAVQEQRRNQPGARRADNYPAASWEPLPGGGWRSPAGRTFAADTQMAGRLRDRWRAEGRPVDVPGHG
jgi:hypothetical protein